jgi:hypothetical protein
MIHKIVILAIALLLAAAASEDFARLFKPQKGLACFGDFHEGFVFVGKTEADYKKMRSLIWLDGKEREHIPVSKDDPQAKQARCYAVGPHRGLNVKNWCCREKRK